MKNKGFIEPPLPTKPNIQDMDHLDGNDGLIG
jgi:hypothetical protein